ncbi:MAG: hypothetical protein E7486_02820 [Ruminococcaceae bacterium]|nr:hypothetical protein [Oscillospiraceae bacterium]
MTRLKGILCGAVIAALLCGCAYLSPDPESLLSPPMLSSEQESIRSALMDSLDAFTKNKVSLKYPAAGEYRTAFIKADLIAGDGIEEAIAFYTLPDASGDSLVRINLLRRREEGGWYSACDVAGAGTDIEQVVFAKESGGELILGVSWTGISQKGKRLVFYRWQSSPALLRASAEVTCDAFALQDMDLDGRDDLFLFYLAQPENVTNQTVLRPAYQMDRISIPDLSLAVIDSVELSSQVTSISRITAGLVSKGTPALFVDGLTAEGELSTQILYYQENELQNPLRANLTPTLRPAGSFSADFKGDGILDLPFQRVFPGHSQLTLADQQQHTAWYRYENGALALTAAVYRDPMGYSLQLPEGWINASVTVSLSQDMTETTYFLWKGELSDRSAPLLQVRKMAEGDPLPPGYSYYNEQDKTFAIRTFTAEETKADAQLLVLPEQVKYWMTVAD